MNNIFHAPGFDHLALAWGLGGAAKKAWKLLRFFIRLMLDMMIVAFVSDDEEEEDHEEAPDESEFMVRAPSEFDCYRSRDGAMA